LQKIGVLGAGAWGTALAVASVRAGRDTILWAREEEVVASVNDEHVNKLFLPAVTLDPKLKATSDLADLADRDAILVVSPAQHLRAMVRSLKAHVPDGVPLVICSKGIEVATGKLLSQAIEEEAPNNPVAVLSGPTFAIEVARGLPCALTLATRDGTVGMALVEAFGHTTFRPYYNSDIVGAQIGGPVKNVLAIATGMAAGLGVAETARVPVITRGLTQIYRMRTHYGARNQTP
jgi:glycerol-3-phosphate dehydrogenase (NAD(P)+)